MIDMTLDGFLYLLLFLAAVAAIVSAWGTLADYLNRLKRDNSEVTASIRRHDQREQLRILREYQARWDAMVRESETV